MRLFKKNIALLLSFSMIISISIFPVQAADYVSRDSIWHWLGGKGGIFQSIAGYVSGRVCSSSPDSYHHADSYNVPIDGTDYFDCVCTYCGEPFAAYESDLKQSYDDYLTTVQDTIGTTSVGSGGYYIYGDCGSWTKSVSTPELTTIISSTSGLVGSCSFCAAGTPSRWDVPYVKVELATTVTAPVAGYYTYSPIVVVDNNTSYAVSSFPPDSLTFVPVFRMVGQACIFSDGDYTYEDYFFEFSGSKDISVISNVSVVFRWLVEPIGYNVNDFTQQIGGANSRFTNINGDIGYYGDNGQLIVAENASIVDETNNTYFNPVTNSNNTITDWSYDYSTRTYNLTLADGDKTSITYGDENITIIEGDTTYNIYYVVPNDTTACEHTYQQTSTTPATCVQAGSTLYTCSKCQTTKTEAIPALGHDWTVKQSVTTQYDDAGNLVTQGYTLYECSRCGEQYKDEIGTGPPDSGGGTDTGDSDGVFKSVFSLLLDFFKFFWQSFNAFAKNGIRSFLKALADGASDIFGLLNPLNWLK